MVSSNGMKDILVPIDKAGRVVLPKNVRKELAIDPGDLLAVTIQGSEITLRPRKGPAGFIRKGQALVFSAHSSDALTCEDVNSVLATEREKSVADVLTQLRPPNRKK